MMHQEIFTKTVLSLVLLVCRPAQSLETGYEYPGNANVKEDILHDDLKCTYLFGGLTHMLVIDHLMGPPFFFYMKTAIAYIVNYSRILKCQIDSLYRLKLRRIGALWALLLYTGMVIGFYENSPNKEEDGWEIIATHGYVIGQLREDLTDCREGNSFDSYNRMLSSKPNPSRIELINLMKNNIAEAKDLLTKNNICGLPFSEFSGNTLQVGNLFLNNLGSKSCFVEDLMDAFNVQVDWSGAGERLAQVWRDAHTLNWVRDKLENIKSFYTMTFNFLKIIKFRLTVKHLNYLQHFFGTYLYVYYAQKWYNKVKEFSDMLCLSDDSHVQDLLVYLDDLVKREETADSVISYLNATLKTLCLPLGCEATKKFGLDGKELQTPFKSAIKNEDLKIKNWPVPIEFHSLENAKAFLSYLSWLFNYVDFNFIRLLVEYVNEVKP